MKSTQLPFFMGMVRGGLRSGSQAAPALGDRKAAELRLRGVKLPSSQER